MARYILQATPAMHAGALKLPSNPQYNITSLTRSAVNDKHQHKQ